MSVLRVHDMDEPFLLHLRIVRHACTLPYFSVTFHSIHTSSQSWYNHPLPSGMPCSFSQIQIVLDNLLFISHNMLIPFWLFYFHPIYCNSKFRPALIYPFLIMSFNWSFYSSQRFLSRAYCLFTSVTMNCNSCWIQN